MSGGRTGEDGGWEVERGAKLEFEGRVCEDCEIVLWCWKTCGRARQPKIFYREFLCGHRRLGFEGLLNLLMRRKNEQGRCGS